MKKGFLLITALILIIGITGGFTGCGDNQEGALPQFSIGDKWVSRWHTGGEAYTVTAEITGEEFFAGKDCYVMEMSFDPPFDGTLTGVTNKYEKATLNIITMDMCSAIPGEFTSITYETSGTPFYPLSVGKEIAEVELQTITSGNSAITQTQNVTTATTTVVEKMEKITVEAGTFKCFKLLKYDEYGNLIQITWRSDETKLYQVKMTDMAEEDAIFELISYSVSKQ